VRDRPSPDIWRVNTLRLQFERLTASGQNVHHLEIEDEGDVSPKRRQLLIQRRFVTLQHTGMTGYTPAEVLKT
jgi:hypothetical protein